MIEQETKEQIKEIQERPFISLTPKTMKSLDWIRRSDTEEKHIYNVRLSKGDMYSLSAGEG